MSKNKPITSVIDNDWRNMPFSNPKAEIRIGTLFSGIGAIEQAFKRLKLNHSIIFASDIDVHVKQSYFANYNIDPKNWHDDVTKFDASKYKNKIDLLCKIGKALLILHNNM